MNMVVKTRLPSITLVLLLILCGTPAFAETDVEWARKFAIPGFEIIWYEAPSFGHCFTFNHNDKQWHDCSDMKSSVGADFVEMKTNVNYQIDLATPGKWYFIMEASVDDDAWFYKHVKPYLYKYNPATAGWDLMAGPMYKYAALYKGKKLVYRWDYAVKISKGQNPLPLVKNPDGTVTLKTVLPTMEAGTYRMHFRAADRGPDVYLPSRARAALFLSTDHAAGQLQPGQPAQPPDGTPGTDTPSVRPTPSGSQGTILQTEPGRSTPTSPATPSPSHLTGVWEMTCVGDRTYQFTLRFTQSGDSLHGDMVRTNDSEPITAVEGRVLPDGRIEFTRSSGMWYQHYLGRVILGDGDRSVTLEGTFGIAGQENHQWRAKLIEENVPRANR